MSKRKICIVTSSRADYGLLYWVMKDIQSEPELLMQIIATGTHLSPEFGLTYRAIENDGFRIDAMVDMLLASDTPVGIAKSIGLGVIGFADVLEHLKPDILLVLGDRFEILAAVEVALVARIPVAHIAGGDSTEGAYDEAIRHCVTKMAHLHFVTNELAAQRIRQLGENSDYIFNVGSPGVDYIKRMKLLGRDELEKVLAFKFYSKNLIVTFHPVTLDQASSMTQFREILAALDRLGNDIGIAFTGPNADNDSRVVMKMIDDYVSTHPNARYYSSLGQINYLSLVGQVDAVVGNSSSGLYEVPSLQKPTVNIGDRQKGRLLAASVINCPPDTDAIYNAINKAFGLDCSSVKNPYGDGHSAERIVSKLKAIRDPKDLLKKHFFIY